MGSGTVTANQEIQLNFEPETVGEEILQNIAMILATPKYSVPLDRGFGLEQTFLDKPHSVAKTMIVTDVLDAIEQYEPRAKVVEVTFSTSATMALIPTVEVEFDGD